MNPANQQLAFQIAAWEPIRLPEPFLPPQIIEQLSPALASDILDAMRADIKDAAGSLGVKILGVMCDVVSRSGNGSALFAKVMCSEYLVKGVGGAGASRQAISKKAIAIRRALGLPALACPGNSRPKKQKAANGSV